MFPSVYCFKNGMNKVVKFVPPKKALAYNLKINPAKKIGECNMENL
jgi:hypothetical protein